MTEISDNTGGMSSATRTRLGDLGHPASMMDVDIALRQAFAEVFGPPAGDDLT